MPSRGPTEGELRREREKAEKRALEDSHLRRTQKRWFLDVYSVLLVCAALFWVSVGVESQKEMLVAMLLSAFLLLFQAGVILFAIAQKTMPE